MMLPPCDRREPDFSLCGPILSLGRLKVIQGSRLCCIWESCLIHISPRWTQGTAWPITNANDAMTHLQNGSGAHCTLKTKVLPVWGKFYIPVLVGFPLVEHFRETRDAMRQLKCISVQIGSTLSIGKTLLSWQGHRSPSWQEYE